MRLVWLRFVLLWILLCLLAVYITACGAIKQEPLPDSVASEALQYALAKQGSPYVWAMRGPDQFDCSGLIIWAYKQAFPSLKLRFGAELASDVKQDELWRYNVLRIAPEAMKPGDIVFITDDPATVTHGGLFIQWADEAHTEFEFVNASSYYGRVVVDTWPVGESKRGQWFVGAGRLETAY